MLIQTVATLLVLGLRPVVGTPLAENQCVVHQLDSLVVHQLLAYTNATLRHIQEVKSQIGGSSDRLDVGENTDGPLSAGFSSRLLVMLVNKLETEQTRQSQEIARLSEQVRALSGQNTDGSCNHQRVSAIDSLSLAVQQLQQEVRQLGSHQIVLAHSNTPSQPQPTPIHNQNCNFPATDRPRHCYDLMQAGKSQSGVYEIFPVGCGRRDVGLQVWCDLENEGGGWTVILSRQPLDKQVNFNRGWRDYRTGFGDPSTEFWIGNDVLHDMTARQPQMLRVDLGDWDGEKRWAEYHAFMVEDEDSEFRLHVSQFSGNAGDSLVIHDNMRFSTSDRDNDNHETNCAVTYHGGFWYQKCHTASPTSLLLEKQKSTRGINWNTWYSDRTTLKNVTFKIRPKTCQ